MSLKRIGIGVLVLAGFGWGVLSGAARVTAETVTKSSKASRTAAAKSSTYQGDLAPVLEKLDALLENQDKINERFDAVMEELRIVKVRALMGGSASGN